MTGWTWEYVGSLVLPRVFYLMRAWAKNPPAGYAASEGRQEPMEDVTDAIRKLGESAEVKTVDNLPPEIQDWLSKEVKR